MKKTLTIALLLSVVVTGLYGAAYWGQRHRIKASTRLEAAYIPLIRKGQECHAQADWNCVRITREMMAGLLATRLTVLRNNSLIDESVSEAVDDYLAWYDSNIEQP